MASYPFANKGLIWQFVHVCGTWNTIFHILYTRTNRMTPIRLSQVIPRLAHEIRKLSQISVKSTKIFYIFLEYFGHKVF